MTEAVRTLKRRSTIILHGSTSQKTILNFKPISCFTKHVPFRTFSEVLLWESESFIKFHVSVEFQSHVPAPSTEAALQREINIKSYGVRTERLCYDPEDDWQTQKGDGNAKPQPIREMSQRPPLWWMPSDHLIAMEQITQQHHESCANTLLMAVKSLVTLSGLSKQSLGPDTPYTSVRACQKYST